MLLYITHTICCSSFQIHEEINNLKSVWQKNSFPLFFIDNCIQKFFNKLLIKRVQNSTTTQKKEIIIPLEYSGKISLNNIQTFLEVVVTILKLTPFSKH